MSAGSAERNFLVAIAPEMVHIIIVKIKTVIARLTVINRGKFVALRVKAYKPKAIAEPGRKPRRAKIKAS